MQSFTNNCPVNEQTADGVPVGRCWHYLHFNYCPRHGDVSAAVQTFVETGKLTLERNLPKRETGKQPGA